MNPRITAFLQPGPSCPACDGSRYVPVTDHEWGTNGASFRLFKCVGCNLVRTLPLPEPGAITEIYGADYFGSWIRDPSARQREVARFRSLYRRIARSLPPGRLLSIGCGLGFELQAAAELGYSAEGLELSRVAADYGSKILGLPVRCGTVADLAPARPRYDVITFWDVLEHVPRPDEVLLQARSLLASSGVVVVRAPNVEGLFPRASLALSLISGEWRHPEPPAHLYDFSPRTLARLASGCGFRIRSLVTDELPRDKLILGSRRPTVTRVLSGLLYPVARSLKMGNSFIAVLEGAAEPHRRPSGGAA